MRGQQQVYDYLKKLNISFEYYEHESTPTAETASTVPCSKGTTFCKNLFFRNYKGNRHYLVIMEASREMDIHAMEHRLKQGKISFASPERMMRHLGVTPGSVSLFTLVNDQQHEVMVYLDSDLRLAEKISFHPNDNTATLVISGEDMMKFLTSVGNPYEFIDLCEA